MGCNSSKVTIYQSNEVYVFYRGEIRTVILLHGDNINVYYRNGTTQNITFLFAKDAQCAFNKIKKIC